MARTHTAPDTSSFKGHFVEVAGSDGILHHVGPFKLLADAERWIERNTPTEAAQTAAMLVAPIDVMPHAV